MNNETVNNPNDHRVMSFHNSTTFDFTPEMGCMYDSRAINGKSGKPGIEAGESVILPYHIAQQLATNLAKKAIVSAAPEVDAAGIPTGVPLWDATRIEGMKNSYLTDLYTEDKPVTMSETDKLMAKVEEYKAMVDKLIPQATEEAPDAEKVTYQDKQEVIAELEKREIPHDKRASKAVLEGLLAK